ncbi:hypothetical protein PE067_17185 [Paracoccus sp. DMF-8]|uniref:hypothetical protein n=1 Tax=Paracoccus sp. DMF-8 TaxID=3019445 RepID=UPI0023E4227E|nr:hypothetical protein [Paracoccus sp. DMF-8]MDF3607719.1 hypothetical protein [Paracoccus sp. DMF-8]
MTGIGVELLGVIAVGIGAAAVLYAAMHALRKLGRIVPTWVLPAGIGLAMVSYSVWNDYAWFGRALDRLPDETQVLVVGRDSQPWAPWTYLAPVEIRFAAMDPATIRANADGTRHAQIMLIERRGATLVIPQDFDCEKGLIRLPRSDWSPSGRQDEALRAVCSLSDATPAY